MHPRKVYQFVLILAVLTFCNTASAQRLSSDGLLKAARNAAFKENNYPKAKAYLFQALKKSPNYEDVKIFLGRIYTWTNEYDSAKIMFESVLKRKPSYEDASAAYADLEYWNDHYTASLDICNAGLRYHPASKDLLTKKQKAKDALSDPETIAAGRAAIKRTENPVNNEPVRLKDSTSADGLFQLGRRAAFDEKNYPKAKDYLYRALKISPKYADVKVFMGRLFVWTNDYDSAAVYFDDVLKDNPGYEDAIIAYSDMEYWNDHYAAALGLVEQGLRAHPTSEELMLKKGKILTAMKDYHSADSTVGEVLKINAKNKDAKALKDKIKEESAKNAISFTYDFSYFDKQFDAPWHIFSLDYGRVTDLGKVIGRVNLANRFSAMSGQLELDAYPHISKTFYAYLNLGVGIIDSTGFPRFRAGFSLYANLPAAYEAEIGIRYLKFSGNPILIYTGYLGKYWKNWLFSERLYLVPSEFTKTVSASFTLAATYYIKGESSDHLIGGNIGFGVSPDDRANNIQLDGKTPKLSSYKANIFFKQKLSRFWVFSLSQGIFSQEYFPGVRGTQYEFTIGWLRRF